jgi:hypothetical protein
MPSVCGDFQFLLGVYVSDPQVESPCWIAFRIKINKQEENSLKRKFLLLF